ncbi:MAG: hypothetical protein ACREV5_21275 [Steroidobacter sp.]
MKLRFAAFGSLLACAGCMTVQTYDGERREADEVARISGDFRVTAGAPVSVILRQVDGRTLGMGENAVEVLPGDHSLLVDCRIAETDSVSRHSIDAQVAAGRRYRLVAETSPGLRECTAVSLQAMD